MTGDARPPRDPHDTDQIDGCAHVLSDQERTPDSDIDGIVLFADVDPNDARAVAARMAEWGVTP